MKPEVACVSSPTDKKKTWLYDEYYIGDRDDKNRKHGHGENHWTGAESIEWYTGHMVRNTMHGWGDYRWRYNGTDGVFVTYEGHFFANQIHGYGVMSYPDGRVFTGLYGNNVRWGPGEERHTILNANVGFWRGDQLVRLVWRPDVPCLVPDLAKGPQGPAFMEKFRTLLESKLTIIGEINYALDLLKHEGAHPRVANDKWPKLYPDNCTDLQSPMCNIDIWTHDYYGGYIQSLHEQKSPTSNYEFQSEDGTKQYYFSWNNTPSMVEIMKHCFKHDKKRDSVQLSLENILNGNRKAYGSPAEHEIDCRTLLLASYLGHVTNVAQLVNEAHVHPDIADVQGNTALMYATCGNHDKIIHFLVEAGANVNSINDSCCTPLGVALIWYVCAEKRIHPKTMVQCLLPPTPVEDPAQQATSASEWLIDRRLNMAIIPVNSPQRNELRKSLNINSTRSLHNVDLKKFMKMEKKSLKSASTKSLETETDGSFSDVSFNEEQRLYYTMNQEYEMKIKNLFATNVSTPQEYMFNVRYMVHDVYHYIDELVAVDFKTQNSKATPLSVEPTPSRINHTKKKLGSRQNSPDSMKTNENEQLDDKFKEELLDKITQTVLQLLSDGADPRMVKCPKPALFLAIASGNTQLIRQLVRYGADINEVYPESFDYRPVDIAVSLPFTNKNLEVLRAVLECGASVNHRLNISESAQKPPLGPTLLHAVLARKVEVCDEEIRNEVIQTLLRFNCDPTVKFRESTSIEMAMTKQFNLLDLFVTTPALINLNAVINENNQTILVKIFSLPYFINTSGADRFSILTKLLMYGADPLIECRDGDKTYDNIYVYARNILYEKMGYIPPTSAVNGASAENLKAKGKERKRSINNTCLEDYLESLQVLNMCGRMHHIRWIQAKLFKELVDIIGKFKYRNWNMILKEHNNKKRVALWLNPQRCFEIWEIFKETRRRVYQDEKVLKHLLCMISFYNNRWNEVKSFECRMTITEKRNIDSTVKLLMKEWKISKLEDKEWKKKYVKPELCAKDETKFYICFDCALPLKDVKDSILCSQCEMLSFCSKECLKNNIEREGCHPCSDFLMQKYFVEIEKTVEYCVDEHRSC